MNIILPKAGKYKIGEDFPWLNIPNDLDGLSPEDKTFDDFQWWAESSAFKKWLDAHPRQWVADSEDTSKYGKTMTSLIREHVQSYILENNLNESDVLSFDEYSVINEDKGEELSEDTKKAIKFHYAYNKLKAEGKIKDITSVDSDLPTGKPKAVFLSMEDPETKKNIDETLKGFKMTGLATSAGSKIKIVSVTESLPGGPIAEDTTTGDVIKDMFKTAAECAAIGVGIGVTWAVLKRVGFGAASLYALKKIHGLAPAAANPGMLARAGTKAGSFLKSVGSGALKGIKVLGQGMLDIATFKNTRNAIKGAKKGLEFVNNIKKAGVYTLKDSAAKVVLRSFGKGASHIATEAGAKGASRFIPFVGEILMAVDAIGSTFNWFSDNQAPKWTEIEGTVGSKGGQAFNPGDIKDGTAITICWKQAAGTGVGIATSFLFSNDTRTTAELFKIGNNKAGDSSIFILTAINSKEIQTELSKHAAAIIEIKNEEINAQGGFVNTIVRAVDNEDLDIKLAYLDDPSQISAQFNFMGICEWADLEKYYADADDQYLVADGNAPETYEYYYKTPKGDYVNAEGKLLTNEELSSRDEEYIKKMFYDSDSKVKKEKPHTKDNLGIKGPPKYPIDDESKEKGKGGKEDAQIADSENNHELWMTPMVNEASNRGSVIHKFSEFEDVLEYVNTVGRYPQYERINEAGEDETDFSLSPEEASGAAKIAIYSVTSMSYANPADKEYDPGAYKYFVIGPDDFKAAQGASIEVSVSTNDTLVDPRRGVYVYKETPKKEEEEGNTDTKPQEKPKPEEDDKGSDNTDDENTPNKDDYFITADPDDISIKNRKNATVIRDHNFKGGINIVDEFLTDKEKEVLGIPTWKAVTLAKTFMNGQGEVIRVKLKNRYAPLFNTVKNYEVQDGEAFQIAKKFAKEVEDRIKFQ
jgi:hypothetical protein